MKSIPQSNSESFSKILINNQSNFKSRANQNSDYNSLFSVNNSNMDSIDKKIKNKKLKKTNKKKKNQKE